MKLPERGISNLYRETEYGDMYIIGLPDPHIEDHDPYYRMAIEVDIDGSQQAFWIDISNLHLAETDQKDQLLDFVADCLIQKVSVWCEDIGIKA